MGFKARDGRVTVENVNVPGYTSTVDAAKYNEMRAALLKVVPTNDGMTQGEMFDAVLPHLSETHFPGGAKRGWWVKCVQLDLEAKGIMRRLATKPLRWVVD